MGEKNKLGTFLLDSAFSQDLRLRSGGLFPMPNPETLDDYEFWTAPVCPNGRIPNPTPFPSMTYGEPADRAPDIFAFCDCHDPAWWRIQPAVEAARLSHIEDDAFTFIFEVWLRPVTLAHGSAGNGQLPPRRDPDLMVHGSAPVHPAFWANLTGVEHVELSVDADSWCAELWVPAGYSPAIDITDV
jgi:hypothetical protein